MTDKGQSLVPGRVHLPAAVERRTRIANRLLGELTSRDTEAFFRRHPEFFNERPRGKLRGIRPVEIKSQYLSF